MTFGEWAIKESAKLRAAIGGMGEFADDAVALIAELLRVPLSSPDQARSPEDKKHAIVRTFIRSIEHLSRARPLVLLFEDLHWADATSIELADRLLTRLADLPVLAIFTFRPEFRSAWSARPDVVSLTLGRLGPESAASIVASVTEGGLPEEIVRRILDSADGVPIFLEELTSAILESGVSARQAGETADAIQIPHTLHASLVARLDRLGGAKEIAQVGAVVGRVFAYELLREVADVDEETLNGGLSRLIETGLVSRRGSGANETYAFKHALVCDAAYDTLLKSRRRELHASVASAIRARFPALAETSPELVAHHYAQARMPEPAIDHLVKAGLIASGQSANAEVVSHMRRALDLVLKR